MAGAVALAGLLVLLRPGSSPAGPDKPADNGGQAVKPSSALPSCLLWLAFGAAVQHVLYSPRRLRLFNVVMGALLALSIALIVR